MKEFADICSKTHDAMTFTDDQLRDLVDRSDRLKVQLERLEGTQRKVYLKRLQMCRDLFGFVLETKGNNEVGRKLFLLFCFFLIIPAKLFALGVPRAETYGRVIIDNYSRKTGAPGVVFDHCLHRSMFTCRLCHVDIGFAMEAQATGITAELNKSGRYCGACHSGSRLYQGKRTFSACKDNPGGDERKV